MGEIVHVFLPNEGVLYEAKESLGALESVKTAADIYAPIDGTVLQVNKELESSPGLINTNPYSLGWYCKLTVDDEASKQIDKYMTEKDYNDYLKTLDH